MPFEAAGRNYIASPSHAFDASFSLAVWYTGALAADAAPTNLASVAAARILRCTAKRDGVMAFGGALLRTVIFDGTSLVVRPWFFDDTQAIWIPHGANITLTTATTNTGALTIGNMAGARLYVQVITNTGSVTALGYDIV